MRIRWPVLLLLTSAFAAGCNGIVCDDSAAAGINVEVRDRLTNAPAAHGATLIARDGAFVDSTTWIVPTDTAQINSAPPIMGVAFERTGTYEVTVRKPGYREWQRTNVEVREGRFACHVTPVNLKALLER